MYTFYCNTAHELKDRGMNTEHILVGNFIKFIMHAIWIFKIFYLKRNTNGC
jgi:hypothetical protein